MARLAASFPDFYKAYLAGAALQRQLAGPIRLSFIQQRSPSSPLHPEAPDRLSAEAGAPGATQSVHGDAGIEQRLRSAGVPEMSITAITERIQDQGEVLMLLQLTDPVRARQLLGQMGALDVFRVDDGS